MLSITAGLLAAASVSAAGSVVPDRMFARVQTASCESATEGLLTPCTSTDSADGHCKSICNDYGVKKYIKSNTRFLDIFICAAQYMTGMHAQLF